MSLIRTFIGLVVLTAGLSTFGEEQNLITLNAGQLQKLSLGSFHVDVDSSNSLRLHGHWPKVCAERSNVSTLQTRLGLRLRIEVSKNCFALLKLKEKNLVSLPTVALNTIRLPDYVRLDELVYLESKIPKIDLELPADSVYAMIDHSQFQNESSHAEDLFPYRKNNSFDGFIKYRRCSPDDYRNYNATYCNNRYRWDINADLPIARDTILRGSTQLELNNPDGSLTNITGKAGVRLDILYHFGN